MTTRQWIMRATGYGLFFAGVLAFCLFMLSGCARWCDKKGDVGPDGQYKLDCVQRYY